MFELIPKRNLWMVPFDSLWTIRWFLSGMRGKHLLGNRWQRAGWEAGREGGCGGKTGSSSTQIKGLDLHVHQRTHTNRHRKAWTHAMIAMECAENFPGERWDKEPRNTLCQSVPFRGCQKPIKITRIRLKQQPEVHKAAVETLRLFLYVYVLWSGVVTWEEM